MTEEPIGKGGYGDLSQEEASTGSSSKNWRKKTANFGFGSGDKKKLIDQFREEATIDPQAVKKVIKEYKRLKKYSKSNLFMILKLSGQHTIIDDLVEEYKQNPEL